MSKAEDLAEKAYPKGDTYIFGDASIACQVAYVKGYHQAEKDMDISWVKEVSGVKEMSRAEEEALKAYPPRSIAANYDTIARRDAFEFGYLKAEKDLELTWEEIYSILYFEREVLREFGNEEHSNEEVCKEVLKRFKDYKERKENAKVNV